MKYHSLFLFVIALVACSEPYNPSDFEFSFNDNSFFAVFVKGDTIYYKSNLDNVDTILIKGYDTQQFRDHGGFMAPQPSNGKWILIEHLPVDKWHGTTYTDNKPTKIDYQQLFGIVKNPLDKRTDYSINFKDFYAQGDSILGDLHRDTILLNAQKVTNYYIVQHLYPETITKPESIEMIYWSVKQGLLAYKNKAGEIWVKK